MASIVDFEMCFIRFVLFMVQRKYPELNLFDVDLTQMEGYNVPNPVDGTM